MSDQQDQTPNPLQSQRVKEAEAKAEAVGVGFLDIDSFKLMAVSELAAGVRYVVKRRNTVESTTEIILEMGVSPEKIEDSVVAALDKVTQIYLDDITPDRLHAKDKAYDIARAAYNSATGDYIPEAARAPSITAAASAETATIDPDSVVAAAAENSLRDFADEMVPAALVARLTNFLQEAGDLTRRTHKLSNDHAHLGDENPYLEIYHGVKDSWIEATKVWDRLQILDTPLATDSDEYRKINDTLTASEQVIKEIKEELAKMTTEKEPAADLPLGEPPAPGPSNLGEAPVVELSDADKAANRIKARLTYAQAQAINAADDEGVGRGVKGLMRGLKARWYKHAAIPTIGLMLGTSAITHVLDGGRFGLGGFFNKSQTTTVSTTLNGRPVTTVAPATTPAAAPTSTPAPAATTTPAGSTIATPACAPFDFSNSIVIYTPDAQKPNAQLISAPLAFFIGRTDAEIKDILRTSGRYGYVDNPMMDKVAIRHDDNIPNTQLLIFNEHLLQADDATLDIVVQAIRAAGDDQLKQTQSTKIAWIFNHEGRKLVLMSDPDIDNKDLTEVKKYDLPMEMPKTGQPAQTAANPQPQQ